MAASNIAFTAGILSFFTGLVMVAINVNIFRIYVKSKKVATLFLVLSVLGWIGAAWSASLIYLLAGTDLSLAILLQKMVYTCVFLGTMFTFLFGRELFFKIDNKWVVGYLVLGVLAILVMVLTDSVVEDVFPDGSGYPLLNIDLRYIVLILGYIVPTIIGIFYVALKTSQKVENPYKAGFQIIALGQALVLVTFLMDLLQGIFIDSIILYAIFLYLTWFFPLMGCICYYIGWILPDWFKKRVTSG